MNKKILFFVLFVLINFNISIVPSASANLPDLIISEAKAAIKDKTRPTVYITNPSNGSTVLDTITLSANATDNIGVVGVQFLVDNIAFGNQITNTPYQISLDTKTFKNGYHYISARARDAAGNTRTSSSVRIRINNPLPDTTLPNVSITDPTNGQVVLNTITLSANATDNVGVVGVKFFVDGVQLGSEDMTTPYSTTLDTKTLTNGSHTILARARDAMGNNAAIEITVTVNNTTVIPVNGSCGTANGTTVSTAPTANLCSTGTPSSVTGTGPWSWTCAGLNGGTTASCSANKTVATDNLIQNPSFEESDASNNPVGWLTGGWGTNTPVFTYPVTGYNSAKAVKVQITSYTDGDAKWYFNDVNVLPNQSYKFSDNYQSNVESSIVVRYTLSNNSFLYESIAYLSPSANWANVEKTFTTPANAVSLTIFHLIGSVGYLNVDNYYLNKAPSASLNQGMVSLNFDDGYLSTYNNAIPILNVAGIRSTQYIITNTLTDPYGEYVNTSQVLEMQAQGHEIGAHTKSHPDLTTLSSIELINEISGSKEELLNIGVNPIPTFSYPYGEFNDAVVNAVKNTGFLGARSVEGGFNDKSADKYLLKSFSVESNTSISTVKNWIDSAIQNKTWLILVLHRTENNGGQYSTTPENLQQIVNYLVANNVLVVTNAQGIQLLNQ